MRFSNGKKRTAVNFMHKKLVTVFLCFISFFICNNSNDILGADFYKSSKKLSEELKLCNRDILIYGDIEKGDAQTFKNLVQNIKKEKCIVGKVSLLSHGGDLFEAMQIGSVIRKNLMSTEAPLIEEYDEFWIVQCSTLCNSFMRIEPCLWKNRDKEANNNPRICGCNSACFLIWLQVL
jgi:hypothetical protein